MKSTTIVFQNDGQRKYLKNAINIGNEKILGRKHTFSSFLLSHAMEASAKIILEDEKSKKLEVEEQIIKPDLSGVDPMTVVSKGAALFAATIDISEEVKEQQRDKTKIQLELGYEATTVEDGELITIKILEDKTEGEMPEKVFVELSRNDKS